MTARLTVDTITSDQLDALYDQLEDDAAQHDRAIKAITRDRESYRQAWKEAQRMRGKAERCAEAASRLGTKYMTAAEQAEAGRLAADNMLRAVCAVFGGPHQDPVVKARETLARAEQAEAAIARVRQVVQRLDHGEPHPEHDHVCPDNVRKAVLAALDEEPATAANRAASTTLTTLAKAVADAASADQTTFALAPTPVVDQNAEPVLGAESQVDVERLTDEDGEPLCTCTYGERCPNCRD